MSTIDRNQPCPCGSGKRYKHCHGSLSGAPSALLGEALAAYRAGSLRRAETLFRQAIAEHPDDADALNGLSAVLFERLRYGDALDPFWKAAERTGWAVPLFRQNIGLVLAKLLGPEANARQEVLVNRWYERERARKLLAPRHVRVSVVLVAAGAVEAIAQSIESVAAQSYADFELIVAVDARNARDASRLVESGVGKTRAPTVVAIESPARADLPLDAVYARVANCGASRASGDFVAFLDSGDQFAADRIEQMVLEIARTDKAWGFSQFTYAGNGDVADVAAGGIRRDSTEGAPHDATTSDGSDWRPPIDHLPSFALRHGDTAGANGNLFVARSLFAELGGYREIHHPGWDFCVRAACLAEPTIVSRPLYVVGGRDRQRVMSAPDPRVRQAIEQRQDENLAGALAEDAGAVNEFSPQFPANRALLLQTEFRARHGDRVPVPVLRSLADEWRTRIANRASAAASHAQRGASAENSATPRERTALVVLGAYRSGTSALTRVLNLCGAVLPDNLMPARLDFNHKGFWETEAIVDLDARMLKRIGAQWHSADIALPREGPIVEEFLETAGEVLAREYGDAPLILIKDPRMCVLAPLWHRALIESGYRPTYVVSVRHALEVARSLTRSLQSYGGIALPRGLALWRGYMGSVEAFVEETDPCVLHIHYDELLEDWRQVVARIAKRLEVALDTQTRREEIERFLAPEMRSQRADGGSLAAIVGESEAAAIDALYRRLVERCERDGAESLSP